MDFFVADTHFGHGNIVKYCGRPFANPEEMDETIINNWNSVVKEEDSVFHLGDFALSSKDRIKEYISRLNGHKFLVMGNHDRRRTVTFWSKLGFLGVHKEPLRYSYYLLSHEPMPFPELPNIHGHTHGNIHRGEPGHGIHVCVSCEVTNYRPVSIDFIEKAILVYRRYRSLAKLKVDAVVKVRVYPYLEEKVEDAIAYGYRRAHKHTDTPTEEQIKTEIEQAVMGALCDIFDFGDG